MQPRTTGHHGYPQRHEAVPPTGTAFEAGRFGRMVPELSRPLEPPEGALVELGLAMEDNRATRSADNPNIPAGYTYLGQFIDHDITLDTTGLTETLQDPNAVENFRTPRLDLDSVYGLGPRVQPSLYDRNSRGRAKLLIGTTSPEFQPPPPAPQSPPPRFAGLPHDLPRNAQGFALIGDERNDENLLVAQTHLAFLRFHNAIAARLEGSVDDRDLFNAARRQVTMLYQAMVVRDFLTKICDPNDVAAAIGGLRHFRYERFGKYGQPYMPVEFSVAAYRLGHSMVREVYNHNRIFRPGAPIPASFDLLFLFTAKSGQIGVVPGPTPANKPTLAGDWIIDWRRYLDFGTTDAADGFGLNLSRTIDPYLVPALHRLPSGGVSPPNASAESSLAVMNLRRGVRMRLPAAQELAAFMGVEDPLTPGEIATGADGQVAKSHGLHRATPLWYYVLKEAAVRTGGARLGPLGSLIVAETFVGLLKGDPESLLARNPSWRLGQPLPGLSPALPKEWAVSFTFADLVAEAAGGRTKDKLSPIG